MKTSVALLLLCLAWSAPEASYDGQWEARFPAAAQRRPDGSVESTRWTTADLILTQEGQRVTGTWSPRVGAQSFHWVVSGIVDGDRIRLTATRLEAPSEIKERLSRIKAIFWDATLVDGEIRGTMWREWIGSEAEKLPLEWTAIRRSH